METVQKPSSLVNTIIGGISWKVTTRLTTQILRLTIGVVLARLLSPSDFGLMGMVAIFTGFVGLLRVSGLATALVQKKNINEHHISSVFWLNLFIGLLLTVITILISPLVARFYGDERLKILTAFVGLTFAFATLGSIPNALLQRNLNFRALEVVKIITAVASSGIALVFVLKGHGVWSLAYQVVASMLIQSMLVWYLSKWWPRLILSWPHAKSCFRFGFSLQGSRFVEFLSRNFDNLLIGKYIGAAALGYYDKAYQFMLIPFREVTQLLNQVLYPVFASVQDDLEQIRQTTLVVYRYVSLLIFPIMTGVIILAPEIIHVLYGPKWETTVRLLQFLCIGGILDSLSALSESLYLSQGETGLQLKWNTGMALIRSIAFCIGLLWGLQGIACSYVLSSFLLVFPSCFIPMRLIGLPLSTFFRGLFPIAAITAVMTGVTVAAKWYLLPHLDSLSLALACTATGAAVYLGLIMLLQPHLVKDAYAFLLRRSF